LIEPQAYRREDAGYSLRAPRIPTTKETSMTFRQKTHGRAIFLLLATAAAALAFAGPAAAHDGSDDHPGFDGDEAAGKIASFDPDSGVLVIDLAAGGSVSGLVTSRTWIESDDDRCEARRRPLHGWCRRKLHHFEHGDHGWHRGRRGSSDDLVAGATVEDALLVLKDGRAFFWKVELGD
jgi:hypothetical protein